MRGKRKGFIVAAALVLAALGVEASGQSVEVAGMTRYHIADGKIQREQGIVDNFGLMMQLGAVPVSEEKG